MASAYLDDPDARLIEPKAIFGFDGQIEFGLQVHPDGKHLIFALGYKIGITTLATNKQQFINGHTNTISCFDLSPTGNYLASGQINHMGFRAYVILRDWETKKEIGRHDLHKVRVQSLAFTAECKYLISLGGQDDGTIIVYDIETRTPICQAIASKSTSGNPTTICRLHNINSVFVIAGDRHLRIWSLQRQSKKLTVQDVLVGKTQRRYTSIHIDSNDENLYLTTMTGDLVKVRLNGYDPNKSNSEVSLPVLLGSYGRHNPKRPKGKDCEKYVNGLRHMRLVKNNVFLMGAGDGVVELVEERGISFKNYPGPTWPNLKIIHSTKVKGAVTSLTKVRSDQYLIGTDNNEVFSLNLKTFDLKLLTTCHRSTIYDIVFPKELSLVFATAGDESIRIWSTKRMQELLRIMVYNFSCSSIKFNNDGTSIISAWNDGVLRAFTPITGKLIWAIPNAHNKGCSAIAISSNARTMVSGGIEGQVRVWKIEAFRQSLIGVLKEHSAPISTVDFNKFDSEVVSASHDGSCVIWDINRLTRKHVFYANTQFMCARYFPTGVQILTSGSDRRISYWEVYDGSLVRELEGSPKASINSVSINTTGQYFVSGGNDQYVKVWDYQKGVPVLYGTAHAAPVVSCQYSPCGKFFVSGSADGAVVIWDIPEEFWPKPPEDESSKDDTISLSHRSSKSSIHSKRSLGSVKKENIEQLDTKKQVQSVVCAECPPVDTKAMPDINESCNYIPKACEQRVCNNL